MLKLKVEKEKIEISEDFLPMFNYLIKINEELESVLNLKGIIRTKILLLLQNLEILFNVYLIYKFEPREISDLKKLAKDDDSRNYKDFLNKFFLNDKNTYYKDNKKVLKKLNAKIIINLRNSLTHFYATTKEISLYEYCASSKIRANLIKNDLEKNALGHVVLISDKDLKELIKESGLLFFNEISDGIKNANTLDKIQKMNTFLKNNSSISI